MAPLRLKPIKIGALWPQFEVVVGVPTAWGASIRELDSRNLRTESKVCQGTSNHSLCGMCGKFH